MTDEDFKAKVTQKYHELNERITALDSGKFSIENWVEVCDILFMGAKVAEVAKEPDISLLPFYRNGLKYLTHAPKEAELDHIISSFDDSYEFYSFEEQLQIARPFAQFMDRLERWAESMDMEDGPYWRERENVNRWSVPNPEDYDEDDLKPPYYAWVLVNINKIRNHFDPPIEPYATELNNNMYSEHLFAFRQSRAEWCFKPGIVEILRRQMSEIPEENPLVGKYLAWGAPSKDDIPQSLLVPKENCVSQELFEKNLRVKAKNYQDLFETLNGNVERFFQEKRNRLRTIINKDLDGLIYENKSPSAILLEKIDAIRKGVSERYLHGMNSSWARFLAETLKLPRYKMWYYDWGSCNEEGPDEPGLVYHLEDGNQQHVYYQISQSEWFTDLDTAEYRIDELIQQCKNIGIEHEMQSVFEQWLDIETKWISCKSEESCYHYTGDLSAFAKAFCEGLIKVEALLPHLRKREEPKAPPKQDPRYDVLDTDLAKAAKIKPSVMRFNLLRGVITKGISLARQGEIDFNVWESRWLSAALLMLSEDPIPQGGSILDKEHLFRGVSDIFESLAGLLNMYSKTDPEMLADEFDYFYQELNRIMGENYKPHPETGQKGFLITDEFITRKSVESMCWRYRNDFVARVASKCTFEKAVKYYEELPIDEESSMMVKAANNDNQDCVGLSTNILFSMAIEPARNLLSLLQDEQNPTRLSILGDGNLFDAVTQPFFGTYFDPYTGKLDDKHQLLVDPKPAIDDLNSLIAEMFTELERCIGESEAYKKAAALWQDIKNRYELRLKMPLMSLNCEAQEKYLGLMVSLNDAIKACATEPIGSQIQKKDAEKSSEGIISVIKSEFKQLKEEMPGLVKDGMTDKGGRPKKSEFKRGYLTQEEVALTAESTSTVDASAIVKAPLEVLPALLNNASPETKVLAAIGLATYAQVGKQNTTLNRIDERTRKESECKQEKAEKKHGKDDVMHDIQKTVHRIEEQNKNRAEQEKKKEERRSGEDKCYEYWNKYLDGELGEFVQSGKKPSFEDLFSKPRVKSELAKYHITTKKQIADAVRNARNRVNSKK